MNGFRFSVLNQEWGVNENWKRALNWAGEMRMVGEGLKWRFHLLILKRSMLGESKISDRNHA